MYLHRPDAADTDVALEGFLPRQSGQYGENWSSLIGIVTAIVGNVLISFALNMQRYAHIRLDREFQQKRSPPSNIEAQNETAQNGTDETDETAPLLGSQPRKHTLPNPDKQQSYLTSPYWWAGIVLMTIGEAGNFLAYGFAPASIVSPLGVVALISNCIIAPFMLKERFRWRDAAGVVVAVGGAVTVVLSASDNNPKLGPDEIWGLIKRWEFETYLGVTVGVIAVLMWGSNRYGEKNILIDLGLVGLFGAYPTYPTSLTSAANEPRRLHGPLHQGRRLAAVVHAVARHYVSRLLPAPGHPHRHGRHADQVHQPRAATLQRHAGHPRAVCHVYAVCYPRLGHSVPRL